MLRGTFDDEVAVLSVNAFNTGLVDGKFPASGSFIDVKDYQKFVFLIVAGTLDSALTVKVQQATAANGTPKDITGATTTIAATDDNKWHSIEVDVAALDINNGYRYVTLDVAGAAGGNDYIAAVFLGLIPGVQPVAQNASYVAAVVVTS